MPAEWIVADALEWLNGKSDIGAVVTSPPDAEEIGRDLSQWAPWYALAVSQCICAASDGAPAIFYCTDRKAGGVWHSKAAMVLDAAREARARVLWHKIVLRRVPGATDIHRPGYSHLIAVSREASPGAASPDVLERGRMIYPNATGLKVAAFICQFAKGYSARLVDPFCGMGTIPAMASAIGMDAIGVDIDPAQIEQARRLKITPK